MRTDEGLYWEDVEPQVAAAVRGRVEEFQQGGIGGVDLYLASFGPALEEFSRHWPLKRGTPRKPPEERRRRRQLTLLEEEWDPYAATPEDALDTARREVKRWRLEQFTKLARDDDFDAPTAFFVLAWDTFKAPVFAYDEALGLARAVGADMDRQVVGRLAEKKGSDIRLWDSAVRAAKGALGAGDGSRGMIDAVHHAANMARNRSFPGCKGSRGALGNAERAPVPRDARSRARGAPGLGKLDRHGTQGRRRGRRERLRGALQPLAACVPGSDRRAGAAQALARHRLLTMLSDHEWKLKYTPEDGNLVRKFYLPALEDAVRYDRLTGYFRASALALAARGIEGLVRNRGHMRLLVGWTLDKPEIEAIEAGESLREQLEKRLSTDALAPPDAESEGALELLSWMVAQGYLDVKVAIPCDENRKPVADTAIFHEKTGIIEDRAGNRIAWTGSLNETAGGWERNWESISVFRSWMEPERVDAEESSFARLWSKPVDHLLVMDVPKAVRDDLMRFLPTGLPERLKDTVTPPEETAGPPPVPAPPPPAIDLRSRVWAFIAQAPNMEPGGSRVGEATAAVTPWPHQVRAFERLYGRWPPKLLIADEVGLGKTIQAGLLLRQAWLAGKARRILILAPKAVLKQWQIELREKFNLNWPIYDGRKLVRYPSPALRGANEREVDRSEWHKEPNRHRVEPPHAPAGAGGGAP